MSKKENEVKIIEIVQSCKLQFINFADKKLIKTNNIQNIAVDYALLRRVTLDVIRNKLGLEAAQLYAKSNQYDFIGLFGLKDKVEPIHQYIKSPRLFWALFGLAIKNTEFPSLNYEMLKNSYEIKDRLKLSLDARSYSYASFQKVHRSVDELIVYLGKTEQQVSNSQFTKIVNQIIKDSTKELRLSIKNNLTSKKVQQSYIVYRGIDIDKLQSVRVGRYKKNNTFNEQQEFGKGFSFSPDKNLAIKFAIHKFIKDENSLGINKDRRFENLSFLFDETKVAKNDFFDIAAKRPYVVKYKINREDILIDASGSFESEIMIDPINVKVVSYFLPKY
jgi:hypothetical protein